jgi:hypothetical protein
MGKPKVEYVETTQKQELDPIAQGYFWSGQLPEEKLASLRRINEQVYGMGPGALTSAPAAGAQNTSLTYEQRPQFEGNEYYSDQQIRQRAIDDVLYGHQGGMAGASVPTRSLGDTRPVARGEAQSGGGFFGYDNPIDMFDRGGKGQSGGTFQGGGRLSDIANAVSGRGPEAQKKANGGIVALANGGMVPPMMGGRMPNLSNQDMAYQMAMQAMRPRPRPYAMGGYVEGPGSGTSDSIPAKIYQDGQPVQEAALSDGEFVMTERAVRGAGNGDPRAGAARMYEMMRKFERGGRVG